ncbi:serine-rich adhesin for platelets isoform X1 [Anopheles ziemanni]|uniref:serine-rich adhesin for platelets isoform X1 n=1 Tax=Anopheles coustani TaxID=139045 RepID=UPI002657EA53|nr:serine-rich adhesin for platelets isoform X1 [Anopheles coustani]XP_058175865.1 serine-rich adhesin for platelets isoform X1 [Anopheles ziemanni]
MSGFYSKMAFLDDTNGNTVSISKQSGSGEDDDNVVSGIASNSTDLASMLHSPSNDDLSQSLSEYTDADESISAPTELLAEFLSAIMIRDYINALKYCKQILQYEPNNTTARDFYPHILSKINEVQNQELSGESDENYNFNYSSPLASFASSASSSSAPSRSSSSSSSSSECDNNELDEVIMVCSSESDDSSEACCSLPDSISIAGHDGDGEDGDAGPDEQAQLGWKPALAITSPEHTHSSQSFSGRSLPAEGDGGALVAASQSLSDNNTSQSYSSLLLEDEEKDLTLSDISNLNIEEDETSNDCAGSAEHSSSPQDPVTKALVAKPVAHSNLASASVLASKLVAMLRSKVIPSKGTSN